MKNSGGNRPSGGASVGTRLVVLGAAAGALGYAVIYFFDRSLGEERRRRLVDAAHAAMQEVASLSQRLVAGPAPGEPAPKPERAPERMPAPVIHVEPRGYDEPATAPGIADTLHEKVTFFRVGDDEPEETAVLAPVAVITEELPAAPSRHEPAYEPPSQAPTIIAYDAEPAEPEPEPELPAERKPHSGRTLLAAAAIIAVLAAAAALGAWAISSGGGSNQAATSPAGAAQLVSLIQQPGAHRVAVAGSKGTMVLVTTPSGRAVLVISGLKRAPAGKVYQAWIVKGKTPASAGLFRGGQPQYVIPLSQRVPKGAVFAVTVERAGGVPAPTHAPAFTARLS